MKYVKQFERTQSHQHPVISLDDLEWRENGEERPWSRLLSTIQIGYVYMHLEAYLVTESEDGQQFTGDYGEGMERAYQAIIFEGALQTVEIRGRDYVLIAYPYQP